MRTFSSVHFCRSTLLTFALAIVLTQPGPAQTYQVIHTFTGGADGGNPYAGLTLDKGGNLYGTATTGGTGVFKLTHKGSGWIFTPLSEANSAARVIFGPDGSLYGTTFGSVFNLKPRPHACPNVSCDWQETTLYVFKGGADGADPGYGDLVFDQAGNIYGTTEAGGVPQKPASPCRIGGCGVVFVLTPSNGGWTERVIYSFSGSDGEMPLSGVTLDSVGKLYGTTFEGGANGLGVVYQLASSGSYWNESVLYSFTGGADGDSTYGGLIIDPSGNLYGANAGGYSSSVPAVVFKLTPSGGTWTYSPVYSFNGGDECGPRGTLVMDGAGNLYGTTFCDGAHGNGSVFKLTPSGGGWTYTSLYDFTGGNDGAWPYGALIIDANGKLYGTTSAGGFYGYGVVWEITP
jgi:uncharacterized repeat protein (TIGR03803 family)